MWRDFLVTSLDRDKDKEALFNVAYLYLCQDFLVASLDLGPSISGLVTDVNTKLCCRGFILALFQSTTANKFDSKHERDYKWLLPV